MAPARGGTTLGEGVLVVTAIAPLGRALVGKRAGDDVEVKVGARAREMHIVGVT